MSQNTKHAKMEAIYLPFYWLVCWNTAALLLSSYFMYSILLEMWNICSSTTCCGSFHQLLHNYGMQSWWEEPLCVEGVNKCLKSLATGIQKSGISTHRPRERLVSLLLQAWYYVQLFLWVTLNVIGVNRKGAWLTGAKGSSLFTPK